MNPITGSLARLSIVTVVGGAALFWSGNLSLNTRSSLVSSAEAIIGRPLTPLSYAGVARRTTARAVGVGVAAGAVYGGRGLWGGGGDRTCACRCRTQLRAGRGSLRTDLYALLLTRGR
jgi:hypothetical protein